MSLQLVEMLNCYRKHIEVDGGSQNYRGQGKPHVPLPKIRGPRTMVTSSPQRNAGTHVWFPTTELAGYEDGSGWM